MSEFNYINIKFEASDPPVFKVKKDLQWVEFGCERPYVNRWPDYTISLYERANQHRAYINAKVNYIAGNGLIIDKSAMTVGNASVMMDHLKKSNENGETLSEVLYKVVLDIVLHGGGYLEVNWFRNGKGFDVAHVPFQHLRISPDKKNYFYSKNWALPKDKQVEGNEETGFTIIPAFDEENRKGKQIYAYREYCVNSEYYPKPDYLALMPIVETEAEISVYHLRSIKSGFHIGTIISFVGKPTPEEQDAVEDALKEKFSGADKAGSLLLMFNRDKDSAPQITRISPDELDKKFETLNKHIQEQLTAGHHIQPILAGIKTEGQLGARSEIDLAYDLFKNTWVKPFQYRVEKWINKLYSVLGYEDRIRFKESRPVAPFDYKDVIQFMSEDEVRGMIGLQPRKKEEPKAQLKMSSDKKDEIMSMFEQSGESREGYEVISSEDLTPETYSKFASDELDTFSQDVLALLIKDPLMTNEAIAQALKVKPEKVSSTISDLYDEGYLDTSKKSQQGTEIRKVNVNKDGKAEAKNSKLLKKEVRYSYEWRSEIPASQRNTPKHPSRAFCDKMMSLDRFYTRAEIDKISSVMKSNVWEYRGGWWNDDGYNSPSCRHIWKVNIVTRK